jgi:hypothetical protein
MDKFILPENNYKINLKMEKEERKVKERERKDKIYNPKVDQKSFEFKEKHLKNMYTFQNDFFHLREKGDQLLNNWIIKQKDPIIVFLSDFIPGTKISKELKIFKPIIKTTPTISIEEYRKKKKIGEEGVEYLKRLRDKYGVIVLKVLWANLNFKN